MSKHNYDANMKDIEQINIPIYKTCLWVYFGSPEECEKALRNKNVSERYISIFKHQCNSTVDGLYLYEEEENLSLLWLNDIPYSVADCGILVHEIEHYVFNLFDRIGMEHTTASDEAYAYMIGYVFSEIYCIISRVNDEKA